ncbi:MAG TPA: hypothetical protein VMX55_02655 [candidate division Zixibacteria bacterium]|nr:hypothetical protein [candidate division Zixibacteria bacterium]
MIHKILVIDQRTTVGQVLYDDGAVILETDLLTGFISALSAFAKCIGEKSIEFKGADLGDNRFSLISRDHLTYAIFQDLFDNEPFARIALKEIIDIYHDELTDLNLSMDTIKSNIRNEITNLIETEYFPVGILKGINTKIEGIIDNAPINFDLMFLSSISNGIIQVWRRPINPSIMKQFLDIISKIPLEMNWLAEGKTSNHRPFDLLDEEEAEMEAWMIKRVSETNFFIAGKATEKNINMQNGCSAKTAAIFEEIALLIEKALEKEWIRIVKS